jgi:hypothetical protein
MTAESLQGVLGCCSSPPPFGGIERCPKSSIRLVPGPPRRYIPSISPRASRPTEFSCETNADEGMVPQLPHASRRLNSRVESDNSVWVYWECTGDCDLSRVKNLSAGGLFIETPRTKHLGATANLHFLVQEGQIRANAVVRHVKPGGGLGLKFKAVSEKDRPNLAALMRRLRSLS